MANDRIYLKCKFCGETTLLAKWWGDHADVWQSESINKFLTEHLMSCAHKGDDLQGEVPLELACESQEP